jgi:DNA mismatch repair protein MutS2
MDEKSLQTLEFPKILDRLAGYTSFSASGDLARALRPTTDLDEAQVRQQRTTEARSLLDVNADASVGGAHDIRPLVDLAAHGGVLAPTELLEVKNTLIAARTLGRVFERHGTQFPNLAAIGTLLPPPAGVVDSISRAISERGEVLDHASPRLATIRRDLKVSHERLLGKLQKLLNDPKTAPMLQEGLITQRGGRYVIPLRAEFKGRLRAIVHDQSSSGATLFVEPLAVVELNNQWRELQLAERDEERRILAELSHQVGEHALAIAMVVEALAQIDLAFACAKYADALKASEPVLKPFRTSRNVPEAEPPARPHPGSTLRFYQARHPLLDPAVVVPIDVYLEGDTFCLVITGPNTGGKTVTLKTVGLLTLMALSGMHIPAQSGSEVSVFQAIYADIGDEQSIEQSLSTFSGHIRNIIQILQQADNRSLVLLDELGAGTDPQEGAALARAILTHLLARQVTSLVATHYPELKTFAHATSGVVNASVEFDLQTLRPTYHLVIGLPGRSNALAIAERLGLPGEIVQAARGTINPEDLHAENLLDEIHRQRDQSRRTRAEAEQTLREAENKRTLLASRLERIEDERRRVMEEARRQAESEVEGLRKEMEEVRRALARARQPLEALKPLENQVQNLETRAEEPVVRQSPSHLPAGGSGFPRSPLRLGEKVRIHSLRMDGVVTGLGESDVEVQLGALRVRARLGDVQRSSEVGAAGQAGSLAGGPAVGQAVPQAASGEAGKSALPAPPAPSAGVTRVGSSGPFHPSPGMELDLRGQRVEDALPALERHLEAAYLAGLPFIRIIHGKGTGRLRQVVRQALRESPHVTRFESGQDNEGGDGVTIAKLSD